MSRLLLILLLSLPFAACYSAISDNKQMLENMRAADYTENEQQRALYEAIDKADVEKIIALLESGVDANAVSKKGITPLVWALIKDEINSFEVLLKHGADPNQIFDSSVLFEKDFSVMHFTARHTNSRWLELALENGGDPDLILGNSKYTPIYHAVISRQLDNIKLLLDAGANIDHRANGSETPIMHATSARLYEIALYLLRSGADPTIKDRWGGGPAEIIKQYGNRGIDTRTGDLKAYDEFVEELKKRGLL